MLGQETGNDLELARLALAHDAGAVAAVYNPEVRTSLRTILINRGATPNEADDIAHEVLTDALNSNKGRGPLLETFKREGSMAGFLTRVALNRLLDLKRKSALHPHIPVSDSKDAFQMYDEHDSNPGSDEIALLLRDAVWRAYARCEARDLVTLRLLTVHDIGQEKVAAMLGWSQSKVSRKMAALAGKLRQMILEEIGTVDPWLVLEWEDFASLCEASIDYFRSDSCMNA